jgi:hypothetical protein
MVWQVPSKFMTLSAFPSRLMIRAHNLLHLSRYLIPLDVVSCLLQRYSDSQSSLNVIPLKTSWTWTFSNINFSKNLCHGFSQCIAHFNITSLLVAVHFYTSVLSSHCTFLWDMSHLVVYKQLNYSTKCLCSVCTSRPEIY